MHSHQPLKTRHKKHLLSFTRNPEYKYIILKKSFNVDPNNKERPRIIFLMQLLTPMKNTAQPLLILSTLECAIAPFFFPTDLILLEHF